MPHKSRRKNKQPSHLKVARTIAPPPAAAAPFATAAPATATAAKLPVLKTARGSAPVVWPLHVGAEIKRIAIIGGILLALLIVVSVLI